MTDSPHIDKTCIKTNQLPYVIAFLQPMVSRGCASMTRIKLLHWPDFYASTAWIGFANAGQHTHLNAIVCKLVRLNRLPVGSESFDVLSDRPTLLPVLLY